MQMKSYATNEIVRNKWNCTQQMKSYATNEYTTTLHTDIVFFFFSLSLVWYDDWDRRILKKSPLPTTKESI